MLPVPKDIPSANRVQRREFDPGSPSELQGTPMRRKGKVRVEESDPKMEKDQAQLGLSGAIIAFWRLSTRIVLSDILNQAILGNITSTNQRIRRLVGG